MSLFQPMNNPYTASQPVNVPQQPNVPQQQQPLSWHPLIDQYMRMFLSGSQQ